MVVRLQPNQLLPETRPNSFHCLIWKAATARQGRSATTTTALTWARERAATRAKAIAQPHAAARHQGQEKNARVRGSNPRQRHVPENHQSDASVSARCQQYPAAVRRRAMTVP